MFKAFLNEEGKKTWGFVFPEGSVPIESPIPIQAELPDGQQLIYIVAWDELKPLERGLILNFLAERFKAPVSEVEKPLSEKLEKARQLLKLWLKVKSYVSCSFGKDSMVLLFLALEFRKDVPVVFVNTGVDYQETLAFKTEISRAWNLNLIEVKPKITYFQVMNRVKERGRKLDDGSKNSNICCYHLKEKPILHLTREMGFTHCFTGITAMESRKRAWTACSKGQEYYVKKHEITKIHPILYWQPEEVQQFIREEGIPVNPVYQKYGIPRTGCICCTCYRGWKEQLARVNPKLYKLIMGRYFDQVTF